MSKQWRVTCWILAIVLLMISAVAYQQFRYFRAMSEADHEYLSSRGPHVPEGTFAFATRGIAYGMSEEAVAQRMHGAAKTLQHMPQESPAWNGYVDLYEFVYGPEYLGIPTRKPIRLRREVFYVYFDPQGKASKLRRILFRRGGEGSIMDIDLKTRTIQED